MCYIVPGPVIALETCKTEQDIAKLNKITGLITQEVSRLILVSDLARYTVLKYLSKLIKWYKVESKKEYFGAKFDDDWM